jgi:hypothetical protein
LLFFKDGGFFLDFWAFLFFLDFWAFCFFLDFWAFLVLFAFFLQKNWLLRDEFSNVTT